jgi:hypothetical protein
MSLTASWWQLDGNVAQLADSRCSATIDVARPAAGLRLCLKSKRAASEMQVLSFTFGERPLFDVSRIDAYVRGSDLVATYDETPSHHVRTQAYWRRIEPAEFCADFAARIAIGFELILSVNTSLLDSDPQATIGSVVSPIADVLQLRRSTDGNLVAASAKATQSSDRQAGESADGFIARLTEERLSYVELLHPADFGTSTAAVAGGVTPRLQIAHRLFRQRLEKGVILRARVRGGLVEQSRDEEIATAAFRQFAATEPPLTV